MPALAISTPPVMAPLRAGEPWNSGFSGSDCRYFQLPGRTAAASKWTTKSGASGAYLASSCADGAFGLALTPKPESDRRSTISSVAPIDDLQKWPQANRKPGLLGDDGDGAGELDGDGLRGGRAGVEAAGADAAHAAVEREVEAHPPLVAVAGEGGRPLRCGGEVDRDRAV